jgi:hypothetical protein
MLVPCYQTALYTPRLSDIGSHVEIAINTIMYFTTPTLGLMKWEHTPGPS